MLCESPKFSLLAEAVRMRNPGTVQGGEEETFLSRVPEYVIRIFEIFCCPSKFLDFLSALRREAGLGLVKTRTQDR